MPFDNAASKSGKLEPEALNETNKLELYVFASDKHHQAVLVARLDNLGKGASGAAVQNMRLMLGLADTLAPWTKKRCSSTAATPSPMRTGRKRRRTRLTGFLALLPPGGSILELGCGAGNHSANMLAAGFAVRATDGSPEMAEIASRRLGHPVETMLFDELDARRGL